MVESQQAFFTQMATKLQSTLSEHAVQSRSKDESQATEMRRLQHELEAAMQLRKQAQEHGVSNTYCRGIESVYRAKERAV